MSIDNEQLNRTAKLQKLMRDPVAVLALISENEALREANDKFSRRNGMLEENVQAMTETHVLYTWLRKKVDQPSNDFVAVQMNIGHDWVPVHDLDRDLRSMIEREEP
jgi:Asp-tRNA(Asn)/Glu-tRNA(Gln) amidotransferase C subunit